MQSVNMQEFNYYTLLFKGNYKKGVNILKNIMSNTVLADELVNSPIPLKIIYDGATDKNSADLISVMNNNSNYANKIFINLLNNLGIDTGTYTTATQIFSDSNLLSTILKNSKATSYITKITTIYNTLFGNTMTDKFASNDTLYDIVSKNTYYTTQLKSNATALKRWSNTTNFTILIGKTDKTIYNILIANTTAIDTILNTTATLDVINANTTVMSAFCGNTTIMERMSINATFINYLCKSASLEFKTYIENSNYLTTYYTNFYNTVAGDTSKYTSKIDYHESEYSWTDSTCYTNSTVTSLTTTELTADNSIVFVNQIYIEGGSSSYPATVEGLLTGKKITGTSASLVNKKKILFGGAKMYPATTSSSYDNIKVKFRTFAIN